MGRSHNKDGRRKDSKKKVLNGKFYTTRPVRRPRNRWADVVQRGALQLLGIRGWRRRAENRDELRRLMREAKAQEGCSAIYGWDGHFKSAKATSFPIQPI